MFAANKGKIVFIRTNRGCIIKSQDCLRKVKAELKSKKRFLVLYGRCNSNPKVFPLSTS